jgi:hypothetical protein
VWHRFAPKSFQNGSIIVVIIIIIITTTPTSEASPVSGFAFLFCSPLDITEELVLHFISCNQAFSSIQIFGLL